MKLVLIKKIFVLEVAQKNTKVSCRYIFRRLMRLRGGMSALPREVGVLRVLQHPLACNPRQNEGAGGAVLIFFLHFVHFVMYVH